jgi:hypothetical protein
MHFAQLALPCRGRETEVEEAGPGDLDRGDVVVDRQRLGQCLRDRARVAARRLRQQQCRVSREIAMAAILRTFDDEVGRSEVGRQRAPVAERGDALVDQGAELGFHVANAVAGGGQFYVTAD